MGCTITSIKASANQRCRTRYEACLHGYMYMVWLSTSSPNMDNYCVYATRHWTYHPTFMSRGERTELSGGGLVVVGRWPWVAGLGSWGETTPPPRPATVGAHGPQVARVHLCESLHLRYNRGGGGGRGSLVVGQWSWVARRGSLVVGRGLLCLPCTNQRWYRVRWVVLSARCDISPNPARVP